MTTVNVLDEDRMFALLVHCLVVMTLMFVLVVIVGFGSGNMTVNEISGEFRMCVEKTVVTVQDITVTIRADDVTATSDLGEITRTLFISHTSHEVKDVIPMACRLLPIWYTCNGNYTSI